MLWLLTPMVSRESETGEYTLADEAFKKQLEDTLGCKVKKLEMAAGCYTTHSGYNSRWRMPLVSCPAAATGSTFILETDQEVYQHEIEAIRWGEFTGRGYGQVAVRLFDSEETGNIIEDPEEENAEKNHETEKHQEDVKKILKQILQNESGRRNYQKELLDKIGTISMDDLPPSSAISMLSKLLRSYAEDKDFYKKIVEEVDNIHNEAKKDRILKMIKHCERESYDFMKQYLEYAEWKARLRDRDE